jgi:Xaa-Pro aminopeptidase
LEKAELMFKSEITVPETELANRIETLQEELAGADADAALIMQRADLYYFSGTIQQAYLYVPVSGKPVLMVYRSQERARAESRLPLVEPLARPKDIPGILKRHGLKLPGRLGMELDVLPAALYFNFSALFPDAEITDISTAVRLIRSVKSDYEMGLMRQAAAFSDQVAGRVPELVEEGMTELELAGKIEAEARKLGHQGVLRMRLWGNELFYGHLLSGPSGAVPSYLSSPTGGTGPSPAVAQSAGFRKIQAFEPIVVDYVFVHQGYLSDHARIFSLGGLAADLAEAHQAMLELQEDLKKRIRPGALSGDIYETALAFCDARGYADFFMGVGPQRIRFVGHGVGIELDEFPFLNQGQDLPIRAGMTIALEPKLIFPGRGVVGIENTHIVTEEGLEQLGKFPDDICVI